MIALLALAALAAEPAHAGRGLERAGMYMAAPGLVLDGLDRPTWSTEGGGGVGAVGRVLTYGGVPLMTIGALKARGEIRDAGGTVGAGPAIASFTLLATAAALDLSTLGGASRPEIPKMVSGTAAGLRLAAYVAAVGQTTRNGTARASAAPVSFGVTGGADRVGVVAMGSF